MYLARFMYISETRPQSQPNRAILWGISKLHSTHHGHPGNEDQLVGSSCIRVSRSCQIMSWPCLPLPGHPNVADVSCGPIFSGKTLELQGGVVESPNLGVMETVSIVKVYCNFQALLVCLQKTSYWKHPFLEDLPRSASGSLFQRYPEVCS